jgi:predicted DNA-binding transcriptional regulator AlpA
MWIIPVAGLLRLGSQNILSRLATRRQTGEEAIGAARDSCDFKNFSFERSAKMSCALSPAFGAASSIYHASGCFTPCYAGRRYMTPEDDLGKNSLLTEKQISRLMGFSVRTLQAWRVRGGGPRFVKISARCVRYRQDDLDSWVADRLRRSTSDRGEK